VARAAAAFAEPDGNGGGGGGGGGGGSASAASPGSPTTKKPAWVTPGINSRAGAGGGLLAPPGTGRLPGAHAAGPAAARPAPVCGARRRARARPGLCARARARARPPPPLVPAQNPLHPSLAAAQVPRPASSASPVRPIDRSVVVPRRANSSSLAGSLGAPRAGAASPRGGSSSSGASAVDGEARVARASLAGLLKAPAQAALAEKERERDRARASGDSYSLSTSVRDTIKALCRPASAAPALGARARAAAPQPGSPAATAGGRPRAANARRPLTAAAAAASASAPTTRSSSRAGPEPSSPRSAAAAATAGCTSCGASISPRIAEAHARIHAAAGACCGAARGNAASSAGGLKAHTAILAAGLERQRSNPLFEPSPPAKRRSQDLSMYLSPAARRCTRDAGAAAAVAAPPPAPAPVPQSDEAVQTDPVPVAATAEVSSQTEAGPQLLDAGVTAVVATADAAAGTPPAPAAADAGTEPAAAPAGAKGATQTEAGGTQPPLCTLPELRRLVLAHAEAIESAGAGDAEAPVAALPSPTRALPDGACEAAAAMRVFADRALTALRSTDTQEAALAEAEVAATLGALQEVLAFARGAPLPAGVTGEEAAALICVAPRLPSPVPALAPAPAVAPAATPASGSPRRPRGSGSSGGAVARQRAVDSLSALMLRAEAAAANDAQAAADEAEAATAGGTAAPAEMAGDDGDDVAAATGRAPPATTPAPASSGGRPLAESLELDLAAVARSAGGDADFESAPPSPATALRRSYADALRANLPAPAGAPAAPRRHLLRVRRPRGASSGGGGALVARDRRELRPQGNRASARYLEVHSSLRGGRR
jgi:hypothetical protein